MGKETTHLTLTRAVTDNFGRNRTQLHLKDVELFENDNLNGFGVNLALPIVNLNHSMSPINFIRAWNTIRSSANLSETVAFVERTWKELTCGNF